jgi:group II intron reverse transcriptase/maturase
MEILARINQNSNANKEEVFTKLYRYLLRPDLYFAAYKNLYANKGAATKGVDNDTADGFSEIKIENIIKSLANDTYQPKSVRRTYIKKANGKMRPLGIPTFTDKLVQEVLRMVLEAVYEPIFLDCSHGFRPNRSCHTALKDVKHGFAGIRWFVEGDIKGCFDNIDHDVLVGFINAKIKDARIVKLIYRFLKAGYMENWQYHKTYSGTPQGGIISPLLANIYLHELDKYVMKLAFEYNKPAERKYTPEYDHLVSMKKSLRKRAMKADGSKREYLIEEYERYRAEMLKTPSKSQTDKKIKYIRYADDFLIGVNGSREECVEIKRKLSECIAGTLKMELSEEKTLITHSNTFARFLGYDVRVRRDGMIKQSRMGNRTYTKRTLNNTVELSVPFDDKIHKFLFSKGIVQQGSDNILLPTYRAYLLRLTDLEIISTYNAELRGICNFYNMASNFNRLNYFAYLMEYSCLKTLAAKYSTHVTKIHSKYKDGNGSWGIPYETKAGEKRCYFAKHAECKKEKAPTDIISIAAVIYGFSVNTLENRLKAKVCELCGATENCQFEIHHIHKLKDLKNKETWEKMMIAKRRKTLVVCASCHDKIHFNKF